ncbi:hypothetical protein [Sphingobacterium daejeonense]|uniref:hypothetical protein n=1 Tax=Sphingobacterium daejeonense TaxID=371142 RepID=UPI003D3115E4
MGLPKNTCKIFLGLMVKSVKFFQDETIRIQTDQVIVLLMDKERELVWLYGAVQRKDLMMELSLTSSSDRKNLIAWDFVYNEESRRCSDCEFLSEIKEEVVE